MKPNEQIPQDHKDKLYPHISDAVEQVNQKYNLICAGHIPDNVSIIESARQLYPVGYASLKKIEEQLDSYDHTEEAYRTLCSNYIKGWTAMFEKVTKYYQNRS